MIFFTFIAKSVIAAFYAKGKPKGRGSKHESLADT